MARTLGRRPAEAGRLGEFEDAAAQRAMGLEQRILLSMIQPPVPQTRIPRTSFKVIASGEY